MANKKILKENGNQIWPITRADCVYVDGYNNSTLDTVLEQEINEVNTKIESKMPIEPMTEEELNNIFLSVFGS